MIQIIINYHSAVDVITNSSTELFCEVTSEKYFPIIKEELERVFQHELQISDYEDSPQAIQFEIEYGDDTDLCDDFCALLNIVLTNLVGEGNFKIDKDVSY